MVLNKSLFRELLIAWNTAFASKLAPTEFVAYLSKPAPRILWPTQVCGSELAREGVSPANTRFNSCPTALSLHNQTTSTLANMKILLPITRVGLC